MRVPAPLALVGRRALAHPAPVLAVAADVLVVCTLVAGLAGSLGLLEQQALRTALTSAPTAATVVSASAAYDEEQPAVQDRAVREALAPVVEVAGGAVVSVAESATHDLRPAPARMPDGVRLVAVSGPPEALVASRGRLPRAGSGPLEVAAPPGSGLLPGDRIRLLARTGSTRTAAVVVGVWALERGHERVLDPTETGGLLVPAGRFADVAGPGTLARWRALPDLHRVTPEDLTGLAKAVPEARAEATAAGTATGTSVLTDSELGSVVAARARELTVLRALLLVPAGLLVLVAAAGLVLVAGSLAGVRSDEEALLRSRGASRRQLVGPTLLESGLVCGAAAAVAPLLAAAVVPVGGTRPPVTAGAWLAGGAAAAACAVALSLPVVVRSVAGTPAASATPSRRVHTLLLAGALLAAGLGVLAVAELRSFGAAVGSATTATGPDPLLVAAPALLLLALVVLASLLLVPPALRLVARLLDRRAPAPVLGSRFAARAPGRTLPVVVAVALASGTLAFAAVESASSDAAREARASYVAGTDVRVTAPAAAVRAGAWPERSTLTALPGVRSVSGVHRGGTFLADLPADVLVADVSAANRAALLGNGTLPDAVVERPWSRSDVGVAVPTGTRRLTLAGAPAAGEGELLLVDGTGAVTVATTRTVGRRAVADLDAPAPPDTRLVALRTGGSSAPDREPTVAVRADGERLPAADTWWSEVHGSVLLGLGEPAPLPSAVPAALTEDLAAAASLTVGDTAAVTVLGVRTRIRVAATLPLLQTVPDGRGGLLLDAGTALPALVAAGADAAPDEWWLQVEDGTAPAVAEALRDRPELAAAVVSRGDVRRLLADDPSTGGTALEQVLLLTVLGCLVVGALLLFSLVLLRRRERRDQARRFAAAGGDRRDLLGTLTWEYALTTGVATVVGVTAGALVAAVALASMVLGSEGGPLVPAPGVVLPWLALVLAPLAMVSVPLLGLVVLVRRDHPHDLSDPGRRSRA